ncbi:MAG: DEAD/DEAH box helicase [Acidimicrobiia bacterium]|nr:DEAD/DEAH box helicase [Acidimicrobiia bacterium]MDH5236569.1 DEAD/DEAH box helicase [Acidimicrobiia bacterium]
MSPTFAQLGVPQSITTALAQRGITEPFAIQSATIEDTMTGRDVCGRAPTGSGKTLAFGIPLVASAERAEPRRPRALVLAPTRELAEQISTELRTFAGQVRIGVVYGGVGYGPQLNALRKGVDILVACPGRLEDLIEQRALSLADVDQVVLDEADRMADMGFMPAVRRLLDQTRDDRQTILFSATLDGDVAKLTRDYQHDPVRHEVGEEIPDITLAHHRFWKVDSNSRTEVTADAVNAVWPAIIFCRTRHGSDRLAKRLARSGIEAATIHGGRSQGQRTRALEQFSDGRVQALVATDVAARGIHVDGVASVIHYDPPEDHKAYVHRSGRTARAGEGGVVLSLIQPQQVRDTQKLQRDVDLDEPITPPDPAELREVSPAPDGRAKPRKRPEVDRSSPPQAKRNQQGRSKNRKRRESNDERTDRGRGQSEGRGDQRPAAKKQATADTRKRTGPKKGRHPAKPGNRKARRAHLQRDTSGQRKAS